MDIKLLRKIFVHSVYYDNEFDNSKGVRKLSCHCYYYRPGKVPLFSLEVVVAEGEHLS